MLLDKLFSMAGQGNNRGTNGVHFPFGQALSNGCRSKKLVIFKILHISDAIKAIPIICTALLLVKACLIP